jgi:hypothetical protein
MKRRIAQYFAALVSGFIAFDVSAYLLVITLDGFAVGVQSVLAGGSPTLAFFALCLFFLAVSCLGLWASVKTLLDVIKPNKD